MPRGAQYAIQAMPKYVGTLGLAGASILEDHHAPGLKAFGRQELCDQDHVMYHVIPGIPQHGTAWNYGIHGIKLYIYRNMRMLT